MFRWLPRRPVMPAPGSTAANPIKISDDEDAGDTGAAHPGTSDAANRIVVSDDEDDENISVTDNRSDPDAANNGNDENPPIDEDDEDDEDDDIPPQLARHWPPQTRSWSHNRNASSVQFKDLDLGWCTCTQACSAQMCDNAKAAICCDDTNCSAGQACGNRLHDWETLILISNIKGLGVMTTSDIPTRTVIGEYCGKIIPGDQLTDDHINGGFVLEIHTQTLSGDPAYIDVKPGGSLCRFVNHSCAPNSVFEERALGTTRKMVVITQKPVHFGEEITVKYSERVSFTCLCGEPDCTSTT